MDQFTLWYIFEGTDVIYFVDISKYKCVADLQQEIQCCGTNSLCKDLTPLSLVLLKIDIDPLLYIGSIHKWRAPDDTKKLHPMQPIWAIWTSQPNQYHLQICVRRPNWVTRLWAPTPMEHRPQVLTAALHLHHVLWGKNLDGQLESLGNGGGLKYLPMGEVKHLGLQHFGYQEDIFLFRQEYITAFESLHLGSPTSKPSVIVIGHPGIGKSSFLYYLLLCQLSDKRPTALQLSDCTVLFQDTGAQVYYGKGGVTIPEGTLALTGAYKKSKSPSDAFLSAEKDGKARIIQTTSLSWNSWKEWHEEHKASVYVMDHFSFDEIRALGNVLGLNVSELLRIYNMWGPSARNCLQFSRQHSLEATYKSGVDAAVLGFVKDFHTTQRELDGLKFSGPLFSIQPKNNSVAGRAVPIAQVATRHINFLILKATIDPEVDAAERIAFYRLLSKHKSESFRSSASSILKTYVLAWLSAYPASTPIPCTAATMTDHSMPKLEIPVCSKDRSIPLANLNSIRNVPPPFCLLTAPQTCAPVDAIVCGDEVIITVQVTNSSRYQSDFEQIHAQLSLLFGESRQWCHVFVTADEENADVLRCELREGLPADLRFNIAFFITVFNLGLLSPIRERLGELIEERERAILDDDGDVMMG